jgi:hypothetical protein
VKAMVGEVFGGAVVVVVGVVVVGVATAAAVTGGIGLDTVDEHPEDVLHGPVVIVAVFVMVPVAAAATVALNVTVAVWPAARFTAKFHVLPEVFVTVQVSGEVAAHVGVPLIVRFDGRVSVIVADPAPSPTFFMATVYGIVEPAVTDWPFPGVSVFVTVKSGTGLVTVDEHWIVTACDFTASAVTVTGGFGLQTPSVIVAVFTTSAVSVAASLALNVTVAV